MAAKKKSTQKSKSESKTKTAAKAASGVKKKSVATPKRPGAAKSSKPSAQKQPASAKKKTTARKTAGKAAGKTAPAKAPTVVNSVSAAAKRIQEREARRKKRASARLATKSKEVTAKKMNGVKIGEPKKPAVGKPLTKRDLEKFKKLLLELRDRIVGDIQFLTTDNLHRAGRETGADLSGASQHSADHGTDNFDREFALSLATTEQDVLYEVDDALMRIQEGTYGICEMTGERIEKARLQVIPYTRYSVKAQAQMEQGRAKYRPFAQAFKSW